MTKLSLQFLGGAGTVTGSKTVLSTPDYRVMIDCGLFQGLKELRLLNWQDLPVKASEINAAILTHAHLDHSGYLPLLVKQGFQGKIYATPPTRDIAEIILKDSAKLQTEDAQQANVKGYTKHHPARPLYTEDDVGQTLKQFVIFPDQKWIDLAEGIRFRFVKSGHILGSAFVELECLGKTFVFSGDLGRPHPLLLEPRETIAKADYLILESTYGGRMHPPESPMKKMAEIVNKTIKRGGVVIIPSFAVGRAQEILYLLHELRSQKRIPYVPVYLDSPMAIAATKIMQKHTAWHKFTEKQCHAIFQDVRMLADYSASLKNVTDDRSKIVIAGSGMMTGGRVLNYLENYFSDPNTGVLLVGYQAAGTRGRLIHEGAPEVKIHGKYIPVLAEVDEIPSLSAHADQYEILEWLEGFEKIPEQIFLNHGEKQAAEALLLRIRDQFGCHVKVAQAQKVYEV